jgi:hypothetical protein
LLIIEGGLWAGRAVSGTGAANVVQNHGCQSENLSDVTDVMLGEVHSPYPSTPSLNLTRDGIQDPSLFFPVSARYQARRPERSGHSHDCSHDVVISTQSFLFYTRSQLLQSSMTFRSQEVRTPDPLQGSVTKLVALAVKIEIEN